MIKGNFSTFVDLISPLVESYGDFTVYINLFDPVQSFEATPTKEMLPLYEIETNTTDQKEVCLLVKGLGEMEEHEKMTPVTFGQLFKQFSAIKESCKDHFIVLAQKDMDEIMEDEESKEGDYIMLHLPAVEIKTDSDDDCKIFFFMILPFNEDYEHIHYGNINDLGSEEIIYKNAQE